MIIVPELSVILFGLLASVTWGAGDFSGGLVAKNMKIIGVVIVAHSTGLALLLGLALLSREPLPPVSDLGWGALAGLAGLIGLAAFYQALAVGKMGLIAPIVAVGAVTVPVCFGILTSGLPHLVQLVGFGVGLISLWLVTYTPDSPRERRGLRLALVAVLGFGGYLILIAQVDSRAIFWPLVAARVTSLTLVLALALFRRTDWRPQSYTQLLTAFLTGAFDVGGNVFYSLAVQSGRMDIAAVVSSLYPGTTVMLAWWVLKERLVRLQVMGIIAAILAIILISYQLPASS